MCKVKRVARKDNQSPNSAVPLSSTEHFSIFQLIVLVFQPATLLFWFTLIAPISIISSRSRQLF